MGCYSHLSDDEREQIGLAEALGHSIGAIAQAIGRPKSTVWRELCRNRLPSGRYSQTICFIYRAAQQAEQLWRYLTRHHKRRRPRPIETFARYHQGSRLHPRTAQACRGQNRGRPLGG